MLPPHQNVLIIHRDYRTHGGEDFFLDEILLPALKTSKIEYDLLRFNSLKPNRRFLDFLEILLMSLGFEKLRPSYFAAKRKLRTTQFSHVILNNFLPTLSLELPKIFKINGARTISWVHNSRVDCANGLHFNGREKCKRCLYKGSRWSFFFNCQKNFFQGLTYSLAYRNRRVPKEVIKNIDLFLCNSNYSKANLEEVFKAIQTHKPARFLAMPVPSANHNCENVPDRFKNIFNEVTRNFFLFVGRVSYEKGADLFAQMARQYPEKSFVLCGDGPLLRKIQKQTPKNLVLLGRVSKDEKAWLYKQCEALVIPSRVPETSSLVVSESHFFGTPIIYPPGGGAEETVKTLGRTGCTIAEFRGQSFSRQKPRPGFSFEDFAASLKEYLV